MKRTPNEALKFKKIAVEEEGIVVENETEKLDIDFYEIRGLKIHKGLFKSDIVIHIYEKSTPIIVAGVRKKEAEKVYSLIEEKCSRIKGALRSPTSTLSRIQNTIECLAYKPDADAIELLEVILSEAVKVGASDIHFEPIEQFVSLKFKIDGIFNDIVFLTPAVYKKLASRIKVISDLKVYKKDVAQDGRITAPVPHCEGVDLRVSIYPSMMGETIVVRVLDSGRIKFDLDELGFGERLVDNFKRLITNPQGTVLLSGPSSIGKTTTIYAALNYLNTVKKQTAHIVTIEDPVEFNLKNITQTQVHIPSGITFASSLRSILRQDPAIMMVGEIRDKETAELVVQAGLTGHLVISTIHCGASVGVFARLTDMGIEPYLLTSSITGVLNQRLIRKICPHCKKEYEPEEELMKRFGISPSDEQIFYRGEGCDQCFFSGYKDRCAIGELLIPDDQIKESILNKQPTNVIAKKALQIGMKTLKDDGVSRVLQGMTTLEEINRIITSETELLYEMQEPVT